MRIPRFFQIAALIMLAAGAQPAYSAFWQWSKTAATNAGADPSINWAEGMSPSSVNDSGRAMMARAAEYRDDISGLLQAGGTAGALTLTTNQGLSATPNDGQMLSFRTAADNTASPTLRVDGGNNYPIITLSNAGGVPLPAGTLLGGSPYTVVFNAGSSNWLLRGFYGAPLTVPLGGMIVYTLPTVPNSNFIFPAGQCLSITTYAAYYVALGSPATGTGGCTGTQWKLAIDMRGRVPAGLDNLNGSAANVLTSSATGCGTAMTSVGAVCSNGTESLTVLTANLPAYTPAGSVSVASVSTQIVTSSSGFASVVNTGGGQGAFAGNSGQAASQQTSTGNLSGTAQGGTSLPIPRTQPTIAVSYLLRVI